ncbi:GNAT family N-acetyltransferase [Devosia geojensis]|uniref:GNAT family N-acetyltransferase n=1 Tax=Devosia geojensis TaxID=443610 RepID=UPI0006975448|nr:GNAT family N-acetyltransferase [Devosia geojensis]
MADDRDNHEPKVDIRFTLEPADADIGVLVQTIRDANTANGAGPDGYQPVGFFIADETTGETIGGLSGYALFDWLFVQFLAVPETLRGKGLGAELLNQAESWARERGLAGIWLDTFAFGAPDFYRKHGFTEFAAIEDHPPGSRRHFFLKRF